MFITNDLIYLQLQKTGSTHITQLLKTLIGGKVKTKHSRISDFSRFQNKYIIGSVRNPWDWYISIWAFGCANNGGLHNRITSKNLSGIYYLKHPLKTLKAIISEINKPTNKWNNLYEDVNNPECFRKWLKMIYNKKRKFDLHEKYGFSPISNYSGFYTYRYIYLFSDTLSKIYSKQHVGNLNKLEKFDKEHNVLDNVIYTENLENDLIKILNQAGYELNQTQIDQILSSGKSNKSNRQRSIKYYYDSKTIDLVQKEEKLIIDKYDYNRPEID